MTEQQAHTAGPETDDAGHSAQAPAEMLPRAQDIGDAPAWVSQVLQAHAASQLAMANVASLLVTSIHATQELLAALIASEEPETPPSNPTGDEKLDWEGKPIDLAGTYQDVHGVGLVRID